MEVRQLARDPLTWSCIVQLLNTPSGSSRGQFYLYVCWREKKYYIATPTAQSTPKAPKNFSFAPCNIQICQLPSVVPFTACNSSQKWPSGCGDILNDFINMEIKSMWWLHLTAYHMRVLQQLLKVFRLHGKGLRLENDWDSKTFRQVPE